MDHTQIAPMRARTLGGSTRQVRRWGGGRVCSRDGCTTQLSIYNQESLCALHQPVGSQAYRAPRRTAARMLMDRWGEDWIPSPWKHASA